MKLYIKAPFSDRKELATLGAKYAPAFRVWEIAETEKDKFTKWDLKPLDEFLKSELDNSNKINLYVPFEQKEDAKRLGATYNLELKLWQVKESVYNANSEKFEQWLHKRSQIPVFDYELVKEQFKSELLKLGLNIQEVLADGKLHRCPVIGDKYHSKSGAYTLFLDGYPSGYIQNFKTGLKVNWKYTGELSFKEIDAKEYEAINQAFLKKQEENKRQQEINLQKEYEVSATLAEEEYQKAISCALIHPYLVKKGLDSKFFTKGSFLEICNCNFSNFKLDTRGNLLFPLKDIDGKHWSNQRIFSNGTKIIGLIEHNSSSKKQGCFITFGNELQRCKKIFVTEGIATALTVAQATNITTIAAVDAGNLKFVIREIKTKYPNLEIIIAADNDLKKSGQNVGINAALAVKAIYPDIKIIKPSFDRSELSDFNDYYNVIANKNFEKLKKLINFELENANNNQSLLVCTKELSETIQNEKKYFEISAKDNSGTLFRVISDSQSPLNNINKGDLISVHGEQLIVDKKDHLACFIKLQKLEKVFIKDKNNIIYQNTKTFKEISK